MPIFVFVPAFCANAQRTRTISATSNNDDPSQQGFQGPRSGGQENEHEIKYVTITYTKKRRRRAEGVTRPIAATGPNRFRVCHKKKMAADFRLCLVLRARALHQRVRVSSREAAAAALRLISHLAGLKQTNKCEASSSSAAWEAENDAVVEYLPPFPAESFFPHHLPPPSLPLRTRTCCLHCDSCRD